MSSLRELVAGFEDGQWVGGIRWDYAALLAGRKATVCPTTEKTAHATRADAQVELDRLIARRRAKGRPIPDATLTAYACDCEAWHIGNRAERYFGSIVPTPRRSHP